MIISVDDVRVLRTVLDRAPTDQREHRAAQNILLTLDQIIQPSVENPQTALEKFDALTAPDKLRRMVRALDRWTESSIDRFTLPELVQIFRMCVASPWSYPVEDWTERQIAEALNGTPPNWSDNGEPVHQ